MGLHFGFIADGNRRWAKARGLPTLEGHRRGFNNVEMIIDEFLGSKVEYLTFFLFSTENWSRSADEVKYLMQLASDKIDVLAERYAEKNVKICILGRPEPVDPALWQKMQDIEAKTAENNGLTVSICFNYGGQWEIADAVTKITKIITSGEREITPEIVSQNLYHPEIPPLDLVVRTSGEERLSGFMLWRAAYAEFLFLKKHFPALRKNDCAKILDEYHQRQRRFGK